MGQSALVLIVQYEKQFLGLDLGEYSPLCSSESDPNASAMVISSMLSIRVVSLTDERFFRCGKQK